MGLIFQKYPSADNIPEKYLEQIFSLQTLVWGQEPFGEYKICDSDDCRRVFSIEDVHGTSKESDNSTGESFCCIDCASETSYMYNTEDFFSVVQEYVKGNVSMILLVEEVDEIIEGFGIISQGTIASVSSYEFQTRSGGLSPDEIALELSQKIFGRENANEEEIVCFHQIYMNKRVRSAMKTFQLMQELFFLMAEEYSEFPVVGETKYDGKFYPVSRSIGFQDIIHDKFGYVIQYINSYSDILRFLWENDGFHDFQGDLLKFRKHAKGILAQEDFSKVLYYK